MMEFKFQNCRFNVFVLFVCTLLVGCEQQGLNKSPASNSQSGANTEIITFRSGLPKEGVSFQSISANEKWIPTDGLLVNTLNSTGCNTPNLCSPSNTLYVQFKDGVLVESITVQAQWEVTGGGMVNDQFYVKLIGADIYDFEEQSHKISSGYVPPFRTDTMSVVLQSDNFQTVADGVKGIKILHSAAYLSHVNLPPAGWGAKLSISSIAITFYNKIIFSELSFPSAQRSQGDFSPVKVTFKNPSIPSKLFVESANLAYYSNNEAEDKALKSTAIQSGYKPVITRPNNIDLHELTIPSFSSATPWEFYFILGTVGQSKPAVPFKLRIAFGTIKYQ